MPHALLDRIPEFLLYIYLNKIGQNIKSFKIFLKHYGISGVIFQEISALFYCAIQRLDYVMRIVHQALDYVMHVSSCASCSWNARGVFGLHNAVNYP